MVQGSVLRVEVLQLTNGGFMIDRDQATRWLELAVRVLIVSVCLMPLIPTDSNNASASSVYARSLIEIAFALWLLLAAIAPENRPRRSWVLVAMVTFLGVSVVAAVVGVSPVRSFWSTYGRMAGVINLAHWVAFVVVASSVFRTREHWRWLFGSVVVVGSVIAVHGIISYLRIGDNSYRVESTIGNSLFLGAFSCLVMGFAAILLTGCHRRWIQSLLVLAIVLNLAVLWLTASRSPLAATFVMIAVFILGTFLLSSLRVRVVLSSAVVGIVLIAGLVVITPSALGLDDNFPAPGATIKRLKTLATFQGESFSERRSAAVAAIQGLGDRPVLGYGPQNFIAAWGKHAPLGWNTEHDMDHSHNTFTEVAVTTGVVGLLSFAVLCALAVRAPIWNLWISIRNHNIQGSTHAIVVVGVLVGYFVLSMGMIDANIFYLCSMLLLAYLVHIDSGDTIWKNVSVRAPLAFTFCAAITAFMLLCLSLIHYNVRLYASAWTVANPASVEEALSQYNAVEKFPPMGNEHRRRIWIDVGKTANASEGDNLELLVHILEEDIAAAKAAEPENYQNARDATVAYSLIKRNNGGAYQEHAARYWDELRQMAPAYVQTTPTEGNRR